LAYENTIERYFQCEIFQGYPLSPSGLHFTNERPITHCHYYWGSTLCLLCAFALRPSPSHRVQGTRMVKRIGGVKSQSIYRILLRISKRIMLTKLGRISLNSLNKRLKSCEAYVTATLNDNSLPNFTIEWHLPPQLLPYNFKHKNCYVLSDELEIPIDENLRGLPKIHSTLSMTSQSIADSIFYVHFRYDDSAVVELANIQSKGGAFVPRQIATKKEHRYTDRLIDEALYTTDTNKHISHFSAVIHANICEALKITKDLNGDYLEIGVYKGGSALTALNYYDLLTQKYPNVTKKKFFFLDTFDGFNYSEAKASGDMMWHGTHSLYGVEETYSYVKDVLDTSATPFNLVVSNICRDALPPGLERISVANIDVDMYEATLAALRKVDPLVIVGGIIICEDPVSTPGLYGSLLAMEEFLESNEGTNYIKMFKTGQYFLLKCG
jgi:hypothetical protein